MTQKPQLGDATKVYNAIRQHLDQCPWNDKRNADTLAWMVTGAIQTQSSNPPDWVALVQSKALKAKSVEERFNRFNNNTFFNAHHIFAVLIKETLKNWGDEQIPIALDTIMLFDRYCIVQTSVLYRGRAQAISWRVLEHDSAMVHFLDLLDVLNETKTILDELKIKNVLFLADRGFADTKLMRYLECFGWSYRIRIKANFGLYSPQKKLLCRVGQVQLPLGVAKHYQNVFLTKEYLGLVHVALANPIGSKDKWFVVSNEPTTNQTFHEYGWRFQFEEGVRDSKSGGFNLEDTGLRDAVKLENFMLVQAIAMMFLISEGTRVVELGLRRSVDPHWKRGLSYLQIGWRFVKRVLSDGAELVLRLGLVAGADPDPIVVSKKVNPLIGLKSFTMAFRVFS